MIKLSDLLSGATRDPFTGELYEGLIRTVHPEIAGEILTRKKLSILKNISIDDSDEIELLLEPKYPNPDTEKYTTGNTYDSELSTLLQYINNLGYFPAVVNYGRGFKPYTPSSFRDTIRDDQPSEIKVRLGAKYDKEKTLPPFVYHVTSDLNFEKIKKIGLKPTSKNKKATHPERVYIAFDEDDADIIAMQMQGLSSENQIILTLNTSKFPESLKFYRDPHFLGGAYTLGNIPPSAIIDVKPYKK